ncbi:MAG: hypothetical protein ACD_2C00037G0011 [uncultured bacterium (gcode 4)]|uniref:Uncharacterized protein n=1 Tax=uncultured bacterium (gcode 4) TaxID=1234023 RepID=K2G760_9BACT|nr:MAG: hypothetical protein ACD_2C00037G0011 [uncultured bacterium (gcode 4)]
MTAKLIEFKAPPESPVTARQQEQHEHEAWCSWCSKSRERVKSKVRRLHRNYSKEFTSYFTDKLREKWTPITFEIAHILLYINKILDDICKSTELWELLMSNQCPNKILEKYWDKVAGDYFLVRYMKSWNSIEQWLTFARWCYMTWYEEDKLQNMIWHILYDHLKEFLSIVPDFNKDLDFWIDFKQDE